MQKVAICFSGHLRNFLEDDKQQRNLMLGVDSLRKRGNQIDFFFSIWDRSNVKTARHSRLNESEVTDIDPSRLSTFNPVSVEIETFSEIKHKFDLKNFSEKMSIAAGTDSSIGTIYEKNGNYLHSTPMFYKMFKSNALKKAHEEKNNFVYDVVVRYRSNIGLRQDLDIPSHIEPGKVYNTECGGWEGQPRAGANFRKFDYTHDSIMMQDLFYYSDSPTMDKICDLYNNLGAVFENHGSTGPERILYDWVVLECKIPLVVNPMKFSYAT